MQSLTVRDNMMDLQLVQLGLVVAVILAFLFLVGGKWVL
jgi:hypothetical protein